MAGNFIQSAVKHPGAATAAAKAEGLTVRAWAEKHQHDPGVTGQRARLALTLEGISRKKKPSLASAASA
jgi:hypothetical protein